MPESAPSYRAMTVREFLPFVARVRGIPHRDLRAKVDVAIERTRLGRVAYQSIDTLSKGYR